MLASGGVPARTPEARRTTDRRCAPRPQTRRVRSRHDLRITQKTDGVVQLAVAWHRDPVLLAFTEPDRRLTVTALDMETGIWFLGMHIQHRQGGLSGLLPTRRRGSQSGLRFLIGATGIRNPKGGSSLCLLDSRVSEPRWTWATSRLIASPRPLPPLSRARASSRRVNRLPSRSRRGRSLRGTTRRLANSLGLRHPGGGACRPRSLDGPRSR